MTHKFGIVTNIIASIVATSHKYAHKIKSIYMNISKLKLHFRINKTIAKLVIVCSPLIIEQFILLMSTFSTYFSFRKSSKASIRQIILNYQSTNQYPIINTNFLKDFIGLNLSDIGLILTGIVVLIMIGYVFTMYKTSIDNIIQQWIIYLKEWMTNLKIDIQLKERM